LLDISDETRKIIFRSRKIKQNPLTAKQTKFWFHLTVWLKKPIKQSIIKIDTYAWSNQRNLSKARSQKEKNVKSTILLCFFIKISCDDYQLKTVFPPGVKDRGPQASVTCTVHLCQFRGINDIQK
jgi:hypothetical protein